MIAPGLGNAQFADTRPWCSTPSHWCCRNTPAPSSCSAAAVEWARDAYGHLKAIAFDQGARAVVEAAGIEPDAGVVAASDATKFVKAAMTLQWPREPKVRTLP